MSPELLKELTASLLYFLGFDTAEISVSTGHRTLIAITVPDAKDLIGPNGENLRSLNTLARRLVEAKHGEDAASFLIDVNGYHEEKMETVRQNARMLATRARLFKHDVELGPMSPYERLVIHELFAEDPEIKTESQGEGKFRHIVLKFKEKGGSVK